MPAIDKGIFEKFFISRKKLTSASSVLNSMLIQGDEMYFLNQGAIWRQSIPDGLQEKICDLPPILGRTPGFNAAAGWLFLVSNKHMFRCPMDGEKIEDITAQLVEADYE